MLSTVIREKRKAQGLSQAELSHRADVPQTTISGWENGISPRAADLFRVAKVLGCPLDDLLSEAQKMKGDDNAPLKEAIS